MIFARAVEELLSGGAVSGHERLRLTGYRVELNAEEGRLIEGIEASVRAAGLRPPDLPTLAAAAGVGVPVADRLIGLLVRQKRLVKIDALFFHGDALKELKAAIVSLKGGRADATIDVATFKERFGVSRKFAIPLLEYLDRERVTRRIGESRRIL